MCASPSGGCCWYRSSPSRGHAFRHPAGFSTAAAPERARELFEYLVVQARAAHPRVATGEFGADMQVSLVNDGPVTFWLGTRAT